MNISLPLNFGLELLKSSTHNNLTLETSEGETVLASSVVLALNSPVIDHMTTDLNLTSIDVTEFSRECVQLFIEALYVGDVRKIARAQFRDINKMAHVFKVSWLVNSCERNFLRLAKEIVVPSWPDLSFLFEEAAFIKCKQNCDKLKEIALKRIQELNWEGDFINWYDKYNSKISQLKLDMLIELAGPHIDCLVFPINRYLVLMKTGKLPKEALPEKYRYLLEKCDLSHYKVGREKLFETFMSRLRDVPAESDDYFKWLFDLYRRASYTGTVPLQVGRKPRSRQSSEISIGDKSVPRTF